MTHSDLLSTDAFFEGGGKLTFFLFFFYFLLRTVLVSSITKIGECGFSCNMGLLLSLAFGMKFWKEACDVYIKRNEETKEL